MDLSKIKSVYMIGIKGVGMTMLAQFLVGKKIEVIGSDTKEKFMTDDILSSIGIKVIEEFSEKNIFSKADLIVYSTAYNAERNTEVARALKSKIRTLTLAEALAGIFNEHYGIAVAGSHGKTTTTAWLGYVLEKSGKSPSVMVGSNVPQFNGASLVGKSDYLIIEADEYQNKLKYFQPKGVLLNNIDYDHPDFFPTAEDYTDVFIEFIKKIPKKGFLAANFDDPIIRKIANVNCRGKIISYGIPANAQAPCDNYSLCAYDIKNQNSRQYFKVKMGEDYLGDFCAQLSGRHNIYNALAVIAAAIELEVELVDIRRYLEEFAGTARRMEVLGEFKGAIIIDDYAHHPTEIKATLAGAREKYKNKKIITVFHPHTFTRTKALLADFSKSFGEADEVIILDIYGSAREKQGGVHANDLVKKIKKWNKEIKNKKQDVKYIPTLNEVEKYLRASAGKGDLILLMGAGDVFRIGKNLILES
jgi:UDP-N-acetylmuramate--alanine ligase